MSRYTSHKHGLTIGYGNVFFINEAREYSGSDRHRSDYRALVIFEGYPLRQFNAWNVFIRTPAQQLVWAEVKQMKKETIGDYSFEVPVTRYQLQDYMRKWLEKNVGQYKTQWDTYTGPVEHTATSLFFKRRKGALAFVRMVQQNLAGIKG